MLRRRRGGRGAGPLQRRGARRPRCHRGRLRAARSGDRPRGRAERPRGDPRRRRHQRVLRVGAEHRRGRGRPEGLRLGGLHGEGALHPAAPHPDGHGAPGRGRRAAALRWRHDALLGHPDPPHPEDHGGPHPRHPRAPDAGGRPQRRRRLRLEAQRLRRGAPLRGPGPQARPAGALGRGADREQPGHHPGPGPDPGHRAGRRRRRQAHRRPRRADRRHGRLPAAGHARHPAPGRVPVRRRVRPAGGLRLQVHVGVHDHDAHRRLPGRRPARGHLRHRAGHGHAGREDRDRPARAAGPQLRRLRAVPVHRDDRARVRLGRPPRGGHEGQGAGRLRRRAGRAGPAPQLGLHQAPRHRRVELLRDVRAGALPGAGVAQLRRRRLGAGHGPGAPDPQGAGRERLHTARPGPRDVHGR